MGSRWTEPDGHAHICSSDLSGRTYCSSRPFLAECTDRELNPGYELGKLMSCH